VIEVDAAALDLVSSPADYAALVEAVLSPVGRVVLATPVS